MGSIVVRGSRLYLNFRYMNLRCRESTGLTDTPQHRRRVERAH